MPDKKYEICYNNTTKEWSVVGGSEKILSSDLGCLLDIIKIWEAK
jgi:hypothetical protein